MVTTTKERILQECAAERIFCNVRTLDRYLNEQQTIEPQGETKPLCTGLRN